MASRLRYCLDDWRDPGMGLLGAWKEAESDEGTSQIQQHVEVSQYQQGEAAIGVPANRESGRGYQEGSPVYPGAGREGGSEEGSVIEYLISAQLMRLTDFDYLAHSFINTII